MDTSDRARLDKSAKTYSARFALVPDNSAKLAPGSYVVRARLGPSYWPPWNFTRSVYSNPIALKVTSVASLSAQQQNDSIARAGQLYLDQSRFQDALRLATQLKDREPQSVRSWTLYGDALNGLRRDEQALDAYNEALVLAAKAHGSEPPHWMMTRGAHLR
jgi:tetratricopeptide (TPR) repeat protein